MMTKPTSPTPPTPSLLHDEQRDVSQLLKDEDAATTLEWTLLLAAIALPSWFLLQLAFDLLVGHYHMQTTLNGLPFP